MALVIAGGTASAGVAAPKKSKAKSTKTSKTTKNSAKPTPDELLERIDKAFRAYDFDTAAELQQEYIDTYHPEDPAAIEFLDRIRLGQGMLQRVENISIIDSFTVDKNRFFEAYRLSAPSGMICEAKALPPELYEQVKPATATKTDYVYPDSTNYETGQVTLQSPVFISESGDMAIWPSEDSNGFNNLMQSSLLADGTWEKPKQLPTADNRSWGGTVREQAGFPFLMPDGTTLYFAANYNGLSLGGFDIFVTRDNGDGFLEPQNVGMPYNSPYDDYMLAIDEVTGAGWWATDRNQIPGKVTIYVFIPKELRINYPADDPDLTSRAKIEKIAGTGDPTDNREAVLRAIKNVDSSIQQQSDRDFQFAMPGGKIYERFDDFRSPQAAEAMKLYLDTQFDLIIAADELAELRNAYVANEGANREDILEKEKRVDSLRQLLRQRVNDVVKAENGN